MTRDRQNISTDYLCKIGVRKLPLSTNSVDKRVTSEISLFGIAAKKLDIKIIMMYI
jgi:hypothetical protein